MKLKKRNEKGLGKTKRRFDDFGDRCRNELIEGKMALSGDFERDDYDKLRKKIVMVMPIMALVMITAMIF